MKSVSRFVFTGTVAAAVLGLGSLVSLAADTPPSAAPPPPPPAHEGRPQRGPGPDIEKRLARLTNHLGLTAEQKEQIRAIIKATHEELRALPADQRPTDRPRFDAAEREKIRAVLTPEQRVKWEQMPAGKHPGGRGAGKREGAGGQPPPPPPAPAAN